MPDIPDTGWQPLRDLPNLERAEVISIDVETKDDGLQNDHGPGWARGEGHIAGISIGADNDGRWYFPLRHSIEPDWNYDVDRILAWCRIELTRKRQPKVLANAIYDVGWLQQEGVFVQGPLYDVQFAEALLDSDAFVSLEALAQKYLGEHKETTDLYQWCSDYYGGNATGAQRANIHRSPPRLAAPYAISDADLPLRIIEKQWPLLCAQGLMHLFDMECRLIPLLVAMRFQGVPVDVPAAERARDKLLAKEKTLNESLKSMVGFDVNVDAGASLAKAFDKLDIRYARTKASKSFPTGQPSFTKETLAKVAHPIGKLVREIRQVTKTRSTFIESYILESNVGGFIYPSIHPLKGDENGTVTGRFAMSNPNGQNLPSKDEEMGTLVRGCCVPLHGHKQWRKFDWSQLQYRFLAHYAVGQGSEELRQIFQTDPDADYHTSVQTLVKQITGQHIERKPIKNINFGFVFGMGIDHLAEMLNLPLDQAKELAAKYHAGVPYVKETLKAASEEAQQYGIIQTVMGRKTRFEQWEPRRQNKEQRLPALAYQAALNAYGPAIRRAFTHKALNYKLQGSEGDLMKHCMLRAWDDGVFVATGVPLLTVHDELDFSDHGQSDDAFDYLHHEIMEQSYKFKVPIAVGCDVGANWGACL